MTETNKCCEKCKAIGHPGKIGTPWCGKLGDCPCHTPVSNYERISHTHCWNNQPSPCGIPLEKHTQCCLCDLKVPVSEPSLQVKIRQVLLGLNPSVPYPDVLEAAKAILALVEWDTVIRKTDGAVKLSGGTNATPTPPPTEDGRSFDQVAFDAYASGWENDFINLSVPDIKGGSVFEKYNALSGAQIDFIRTLLAEQKARMVEVVEGYKGEDLVIDELVDDIIKALSK